jgi:hypothetical protein
MHYIRFGFNLVNVGNKVHFMRFLGWLSVIKFGTAVEDGEQGESEVVGDKGSGNPVSLDEDCPPTQL